MKKMIFLSLLVVLGLSFAQPPPPTSGVEWSVFKQTVCQGFSAMSLLYNVQNIPYYVYVGDTCGPAAMPYNMEDFCEQLCWRGSIEDYYLTMTMECYDNQFSPECIAAKNAFFSSAKNARSMFSATSTAHLFAARQALYANMMWHCGTSPGDVSGTLYESGSIYRGCLASPAEEFFYGIGMFCSEGPCGEPA